MAFPVIERGDFDWSVVACVGLGGAFLGSYVGFDGGEELVLMLSAVGEKDTSGGGAGGG